MPVNLKQEGSNRYGGVEEETHLPYAKHYGLRDSDGGDG
jgi:hypothetical protein